VSRTKSTLQRLGVKPKSVGQEASAQKRTCSGPGEGFDVREAMQKKERYIKKLPSKMSLTMRLKYSPEFMMTTWASSKLRKRCKGERETPNVLSTIKQKRREKGRESWWARRRCKERGNW